MDQTRTAAGSRQLRYWLCHPLADMALIRDRHDAVEELLTSQFGEHLPQKQAQICACGALVSVSKHLLIYTRGTEECK